MAAPVAFLIAVTVAVLLVRAGFEGGHSTASARPRAAPAAARPVRRVPATTATATTRPRPAAPAPAAAATYVTVAAGDTFGTISAASGTSVAELERLNPGVSSNALTIGQRLRVR